MDTLQKNPQTQKPTPSPYPLPPGGRGQGEGALNAEKIIQLGISVLSTEANAILDLSSRINNTFAKACQLLLECTGRVVVTGLGKSGHIARKLSATLASTGTPSFFMHPAEAWHGDLGMITREDVILILSNSGETDEIIRILPLLKRLGVIILSLTGNPHSTLAKHADITFDVSVQKEACPLGLAPTASTTAALALGDALALAVLEARGFTALDFARSHPGGHLGKRLLLKIEDIMRVGENIPKVTHECLLKDALLEMTRKGLGFTTIVETTAVKGTDTPTKLLGIFTDGDLRRTLDKGMNIHTTVIGKVMTSPCTTIFKDTLAFEAVLSMEKSKKLMLPVVDEAGFLVGALNMHDLLQAGVL